MSDTWKERDIERRVMGKRLRCTVDCLNERYALKTVEREELLERKMGKRLG